MYEALFNVLATAMAAFITDTIGKVTPILTTTMGLMGTIYVSWYGYKLWLGKLQEPVEQGIKRISKFIIILGLISNTDIYINVFVPAVWDAPDYIASLITGQGNDHNFLDPNLQFLDKLLNRMLLLANKLADTGGWRNPKPIFTALLMEATTVMATAYAFFLYALAKIMIGVLLSVGSFFMAFYLFDSTQKFFEAWFNQIVNYIILYLLVSTVLALLSAILTTTVDTAIAQPAVSFSEIMQPTTFIIITWIVMMQLTGISAALSGGVALSTLGAAGAAMNMAKKATGRATKPARNVVNRNIRRADKGTRKVMKQGAAKVWQKIRPNRVKNAD